MHTSRRSILESQRLWYVAIRFTSESEFLEVAKKTTRYERYAICI